MQRHHSEICETGMMPYPAAYLLANVCLLIYVSWKNRLLSFRLQVASTLVAGVR